MSGKYIIILAINFSLSRIFCATEVISWDNTSLELTYKMNNISWNVKTSSADFQIEHSLSVSLERFTNKTEKVLKLSHISDNFKNKEFSFLPLKELAGVNLNDITKEQLIQLVNTISAKDFEQPESQTLDGRNI